jgi:hypothetical protein
MAVRLNYELLGKVSFAKFCIEHQITDPGKLAQMIAYARRCATACERDDSKKEEKYAKVVELLGKELGFEVYWAGLWPTLRKNGYDYYLPS